MRHAAVPILAFLALGTAGAAVPQQPAPTPAGERVVVPSLPDQPNKEGVVKPSGAMKTDAEGYVRNDASPVDPAKPAPATRGPATGVAPGPGIGVPATPPPAAEPAGKPVVKSAHLTLRGVVTSFEKGVSVTIKEANGRTRTVPLATKAVVVRGLRVGDKVVLHVPLTGPGDGKSADRVEKQKPPAAPPKSKFSAAQTPKS